MLSSRVYDNGVLDSGSGAPYDAWSSWRDDASVIGAVGAAILAASPHNTQPWVFRVTASGIDLYADPTRELGVIDPVRREHHVGLGCALENLTLALAARGLRPDVSPLPRSDDPALMASVTFAGTGGSTGGDGGASVSALYDAIGDRHSNRGPCVVLVEDTDDVRARLDGGRLMQRIHLAATADGLGLQYLNQVTERIDRERELGVPETFGPRLDDLIARPGDRPLVTFRVGHPVRPGARSPRRPLDEVVE